MAKKGKENEASLKVKQISLNNELIAIFNSIREAERKTNINQSSIVKCCKGKMKTAGNYIWRYEQEAN